MAKRKLTQLAYDAFTLEGGLFNAEWLAKVAHLEAPSQKLDDYDIPAGLDLRDEIARAWRIGQALWIKFRPSVVADSRGAYAATERFVIGMLEQAFGFPELVKHPTSLVIAENSFPISHGMSHVPVLISSCNEELDEGQLRFGEAGRRRSSFGLMQEYLNAADVSLWGIVSNGLLIRLLRDNASLTRPAWMEVDLQRIFSEERFADFSALWLTIHASRFGRPDRAPSECPLESWRIAGQQAGTRAREELREGVRRALMELGQGFVSEPLNDQLRAALVDGSVSPQTYFQQLLRLVYRVIFLLTVEERGLLHPNGSNASAEKLYTRGYSLRRLRERAVRHSAHDAHRDLYTSLKISFLCLAAGDTRLALPALGGLFGADQTPLLDAANLQNRHLLSAVWSLAWIARDGATERVNWHDMGPEELGSVYESLLELVPQIGEGALSFKFADGDETRGNARKLSGSYYTPDSLVQALVDSALEPVIAQKRAERVGDEAAAILSIAVIDPAVGSGHFLLAAARRLAAHLARVRAQGQPSAAEHRRAIRDVVSHCLFGVDRNPMALELARIALWLEAMTPDAPLSFLDAHLVLGDALLGVLDPTTLSLGIPDEAFKPLACDDKDVCSRLKKRNKDARLTLEKLTGKGGQSTLAFVTQTTAAALAKLDALPDDTLDAVLAKSEAYADLHAQQQDSGLAEDILLAAYLIPKTLENEDQVPTTEHLLRVITQQPLDPLVVRQARNIARAHHVLHWRDVFAQVFANGGFDCVLGNPPWDQMQLNPGEFFAGTAPNIALAKNHAAVQGLIMQLATTNPSLHNKYQIALREVHATQCFVHESGRYPMTSFGRINLAPLFTETALSIIAPKGRAGLVVPSGIATDSFNQKFFRFLTEGRLASLIGFDNALRIFPDVHPDTPFCLLTIGQQCHLSVFLHYALKIEEAKDPRRQFSLSVSELASLNPNTGTCPVFRSQADAALIKSIYERVPILWNEGIDHGNPWGIEFVLMFMMNTSSYLFRTIDARSELSEPVPLYEAKLVHQFDHRWATYQSKVVASSKETAEAGSDVTDIEKADSRFTITPRYWVEKAEVQNRLSEKSWKRGWLLGFRDITNATNERTIISSVIPWCGVGNNFPLILCNQDQVSVPQICALIANLSTLVLDFIARQKVGGTHLNFFIAKQLPVLAPTSYSQNDLYFIVPRCLELTYTAFDLSSFYDDVVSEDSAFDIRIGNERGSPFDWNPERRARLRAEIDAYYARLYGLSREQLRYILDPADVMGSDYPSESFRVLKEKEIRLYGEYRTQRLVLEAWDALHLRTQQVVSVATSIRRMIPTAPYLPTSVPSCEAEAWLAGLVCDVIAYAGAMTEPDLRIVLSTTLDPGYGHDVGELAEWTSVQRLDRLPQVLRWLHQLIGVPANRELNISAQSDLQYVPGDVRTERLARALVDSYRAQQASAKVQPVDKASDRDAALSPVRPRHA